jgi:hypothetical protein
LKEERILPEIIREGLLGNVTGAFETVFGRRQKQ